MENMTRTELERIISALEKAHETTQATTNKPADTVNAFVSAVGLDTAAYCIAAMVRRVRFDGRISRYAKAWADGLEGLNMPGEWMQAVPECYSSSIHPAHLSQLAEAMEERLKQPEPEESMEKEEASRIISTARASLGEEKQRSAWNRGVTVYALELLDSLEEALDGGYFYPDDLQAPKVLEKALLNGANDWRQYSWGGCSLCYDADIADRLCTPSGLVKCKGGNLRPNNQEEWLDTQARALYQAARRVKRHIAAAVKEVQA